MQSPPVPAENPVPPTRREFLRSAAQGAAAGALAGACIPAVHAAEDPTIRLAFIGCGPRGRGAVGNAFQTGGPLKLYAMADVFEDRLHASCDYLSKTFGDRVDVPPERRFAGFDGYRQAIDCLRPGDIAMLTTRAYCRPTHFDYAVQKGVNVFMEKSFAADPGGLHRMLRAGEIAEQKNLKVAAGLMCRHSVARQELIRRLRDGAIGDVPLIRAFRMGGGGRLPPRPASEHELLWQIRRSVDFLWGSSGLFIELLIHQVDECCWIKDAWPVEAHGLGGRSPDNDSCGQNLDTYSIEYTFADGTKAWVSNRNIAGCHADFATFIHGTKRAAQFSGQVHKATVRTYRDQRVDDALIDWQAEAEPCDPWDAEWNALIDAIRHDRPHNETRRAVLANMAAVMGRAAVHSGKIITWDQMMASNFQFCEDVDQLNLDSPAPVHDDAEGHYPVPVPGKWTEV